MTTSVLEGLAVVLGADRRERELTDNLSRAKRKLNEAFEHIVVLEALLKANEVDVPERPYGLNR